MLTHLRRGVGIALGTVLLALVSSAPTQAADANSGLSLQISPSPLVATVKPGQASVLELKIRNTGSKPETLRIDPRKFDVDDKTGEVKLDDTQPADIADWFSFENPTFTIPSNQMTTAKITVNVPKEAGFSYSLALIINRVETPESAKSGQRVRGSVAIFTLINIDRPDATRELQLTSFKSNSGIYDHMPVTFEIEFKNTGNTIVQPHGNIFIQRGKYDETPIDVLQVNPNNSYILPGHSRKLTVDWMNGLLVEHTVNVGGIPKKEIVWDWNKIGSVRYGPYMAKLVAIYNDGRRDVSLEAETSFWFIHWWFALGSLLVLALLGIGVWTILRKTIHTTKRLSKSRDKRFIS